MGTGKSRASGKLAPEASECSTCSSFVPYNTSVASKESRRTNYLPRNPRYPGGIHCRCCPFCCACYPTSCDSCPRCGHTPAQKKSLNLPPDPLCPCCCQVVPKANGLRKTGETCRMPARYPCRTSVSCSYPQPAATICCCKRERAAPSSGCRVAPVFVQAAKTEPPNCRCKSESDTSSSGRMVVPLFSRAAKREQTNCKCACQRRKVSQERPPNCQRKCEYQKLRQDPPRCCCSCKKTPGVTKSLPVMVPCACEIEIEADG